MAITGCKTISQHVAVCPHHLDVIYIVVSDTLNRFYTDWAELRFAATYLRCFSFLHSKDLHTFEPL